MHDHRRLMIRPVCWSLLLLETVGSIAEAAPTGPPMPWDGPLNTILTSLSGTVPRAHHRRGDRDGPGVRFHRARVRSAAAVRGCLRWCAGPRSAELHDRGRLG